jgi:hypothetical protein
VAGIIEEGASRTGSSIERSIGWPGFVDLDPAPHLTSTSARLDRLIRTMLADPRSLEPGRVASIAVRASRTQDPVSPSSLVREAIERVSNWARSPLARKIARAKEVRRSFRWAIRWPDIGESTLFQGQGDYLFRRATGELVLVILSDPTAADERERLRLHLSAWAARLMGWGTVSQAWWVRLGSRGGLIGFDQIEAEAVDWAVHRFLESSGRRD